MRTYHRWTDSEKQFLYGHVEQHKGPRGLYRRNRQRAVDDFHREWKRTFPNSEYLLNTKQVWGGVRTLARKVGGSSYPELFLLGPVECERRRSQNTVSYRVTSDLPSCRVQMFTSERSLGATVE